MGHAEFGSLSGDGEGGVEDKPHDGDAEACGGCHGHALGEVSDIVGALDDGVKDGFADEWFPVVDGGEVGVQGGVLLLLSQGEGGQAFGYGGVVLVVVPEVCGDERDGGEDVEDGHEEGEPEEVGFD